MHSFKGDIKIIGVNPFVFVPQKILKQIFKEAGKDKGAIPICGTINGKPYKQTLVKYSGDWRLYINTSMLKNSPKRIDETIEVTIAFDPADRTIQPHLKLIKALTENKKAKAVFDTLSLSHQKEIVRYIANLKTEESIQRNIARALKYLSGESRFVGREAIKK